MGTHDPYYVPKPSHWPIVGSIGLTTFLIGAASWLHSDWYGPYIFTLGLLIIFGMMVGWFGQVIYENQKGYFDLTVDRSFRWGMFWFIFSEVCFFGAFFGALFVSRYVTIPELGGLVRPITHITLWPNFHAEWPTLLNPNNSIFVG